MDRSVKVNEKGSGVTPQLESDIVGIIRNSLQAHKNFLGEVCNTIAQLLGQRFGGWWCCFVVDKDTLQGCRCFYFDNLYLDVTLDGKKFTIFKSCPS